ncbi:MAG: valine--tRNA ligase [Oscillospiraceae bacterium]|jgi:valyl-tRNA synthetase
MAKELDKVYDPSKVEGKIYDMWLEKKYFHADAKSKKEPYTIVMPPPNITGQLHMGHALDMTLQDILIRTRRMQGYEALWVPGTDHASIATEAKIVEAMRKEGLTKADIGREEFLKRAWAWKDKYGTRIDQQIKKLGASCDWDRERFTMDEGCSKAVREVFVNLYRKKLIYRGERIVNWCPKCRTSISDAEVEFKESDGNFWYFRYPVKGEKDRYITIATTRPETIPGDTAVAVNPADDRFRDLVGKTLILPLFGREIPVVADDYVDMEFGTGCVKITPAHDPNDFEVGQRHNLPSINIMNEDGTLNENAGKYNGMDRYEARDAIVKDLDEAGYLIKIEPIKHNVGSCYRCGTVIEPRLSTQWFVKMKPLAEPAIKVVEDGETTFVPERFAKTYYNWMYNIKDWCISRQLWWGHRIPAYYCQNCGEMVVSADEVRTCPKCGGPMKQDEDTLDTWFSSALWPFSTLGWPDDTEDMRKFYPTTVMVTGYDIIFFWVARMIFSGIEHTGKTPFEKVFIHGIVRAADGRKMSKSLGNGIDPIEVIDKYGADAMRFMLISGSTAGNDMRYSEEKIVSARNFCNKLWNATRFIMMNGIDGCTPDKLPEELRLEDKWIVAGVDRLIKEVSANFEKFELGIAADKIHDFIWNEFCDWYIEAAKLRLQGPDGQSKDDCRQVLLWCLTKLIQLLHPYMPFITEEIWQVIPHSEESIMVSRYPEYDPKLDFGEAREKFSKIMDVVRAVRNERSERNVPPSRKINLILDTQDESILGEGTDYIKKLAGAGSVERFSGQPEEGMIQVSTPACRIMIPLGEMVNVEEERAKLTSRRERCLKEIAHSEGMLSNEQFTSKAPEKVVESERKKLGDAKALLAKIEESLRSLDSIG